MNSGGTRRSLLGIRVSFVAAAVAATAAVAAASLVLSGCTITPGEPVPSNTPPASPPKSASSVIHGGLGRFTFRPDGPLEDNPIRVWYSAPHGSLADADILIVMHGAQRDGKDYRADWLPLLKGTNTLLLVPEFSEREYRGVEAYNLGRTVDRDGDLRPHDEWSFGAIEQLFDLVVDEVGSSATDYALFGHSAGAQFVHRFVEFMPEARARVAVAANAGWYTVPDDSIAFPYGTEDAPVSASEMRPAFAQRLIVLLGLDDTDPHDDLLQRDRNTDKQGKTRLARGTHFFEQARSAAAEDAAPFNWQLLTVPGVAHEHAEMAAAALPLLDLTDD
ncbi:alpha/beta hydrolase [Salinibacterium sp. ZJ450]|uniref:alpha/beta hydrolase n=1 Tax=Salinibacterium sp. ZJ450 TaxID=2708338 RepID=UPI00141EE6E3|nr:alpha/beta hydrolase [Salinibacterium sp. ZJ450]